MKIHLIYGKSDAGKTTTCRKLLRTLMALNAAFRFYEAFGESDFQTMLTIDQKTICIYSAGDEKLHLNYALEFGKEKGCDILIAVVSCNKHYSASLKGYEEGKDFFWHILEKGADDSLKEMNSNKMVLELLKSIF